MGKLTYDKPPESLADELREVSQNADALKNALATSNLLPDEFPKEEVIELLKQFHAMAEGTAEGCRQPLEYARARLPAIRRSYIFTPARSSALGTGADGPPPLMRGEAIDQCIGQLYASVGTALEEYRRLASEMETLDETDTSPSQDIDRAEPAVVEAVSQSLAVEAGLTQAIQEVSDLTKPESKPADALKRQMRDARRLLGLIRVELRLPAFVPRWYRATVYAVMDYPKLLKKSAQTIKVGVDLARPAVDGWSEFNHKFKHAILDGVETAANGYIKLGDKWEAERGPASGVGDPTKPPADFDMNEVKQMILRGEAPPARWVPWIMGILFVERYYRAGKIDDDALSDLTPLTGLTALQMLDLEGTQVTNLEPIKELTALQMLDLSNTQITDLTPIRGLIALETLSLSNTQITDLEPIRGLKQLKHIFVEPSRVQKLRYSLGRNGIVKTPQWLYPPRKPRTRKPKV
jgi:Leucine Rich repeats (2 copies)